MLGRQPTSLMRKDQRSREFQEYCRRGRAFEAEKRAGWGHIPREHKYPCIYSQASDAGCF
jgi:hypothetical protein